MDSGGLHNGGGGDGSGGRDDDRFRAIYKGGICRCGPGEREAVSDLLYV